MLEQLRPTGLGDVRAVRDDLPPVARVGERGEGVRTQCPDRVGQEEQRVRDDDGEQGEQRRQQAPGAADVELAQRHTARLASLAQEQRRDEVAADDEEDLDAEEAARRPPGFVPTDQVVVEHDHGEHRDAAQAVEARQVPERCRARVGRGRRSRAEECAKRPRRQFVLPTQQQRGTAEDQLPMLAAATVRNLGISDASELQPDGPQSDDRSVRPACVPVGSPWSTNTEPLTTVARYPSARCT